MTKKKSWDAMSDADAKLWNLVTQNITKLDKNLAATPFVKKSSFGVGNRAPSQQAPIRFDHGYTPSSGRAPAESLGGPSYSLRDADYNWQQKLRRGKVKPEGKIDLHGMTQDQAFSSLSRYVEDAQHRGKRFILVVTGKGGMKKELGEMNHSDYSAGRGILKTNVPRWLSQGVLARRVVSYSTANAAHGGDGALYVILKKNRE